MPACLRFYPCPLIATDRPARQSAWRGCFSGHVLWLQAYWIITSSAFSNNHVSVAKKRLGNRILIFIRARTGHDHGVRHRRNPGDPGYADHESGHTAPLSVATAHIHT